MNVKRFPSFSVLIVDDEEYVLNSLSGVLESGGITNIICTRDSREVLDLLSGREVGVVLLDLTMPYLSGQELLPLIHLDFPDLPVIIITGNSELPTAVECMKMGATDYLVKAVEDSKLIATVKRAIETQELKREICTLTKHLVSNELEHPEAFSEIVTNNDKMRAIFLYVEAIAKTRQPVLITGETGVGKELIAQVIHRLSGRKGSACLSVNAAGFDDTLFSDTLFGHRRGAFTGAVQARPGLVERASGGTLFLDEIGDLLHASQVKLLRLLEAQEYYPLGSDVARRSEARILVATNRNLDEAIESSDFRKDLFFRLNTHHIHLPALRERRDDFPLLVEHFLKASAAELGKKKPTAPRELSMLLAAYHFPGNVRELGSMVFDAVSKHKSGTLSLATFRRVIGSGATIPLDGRDEQAVSFSERLPTIKRVTELLVAEALKRSKGNQNIAARFLGITRQALGKRLRKLNENSPAIEGD